MKRVEFDYESGVLLASEYAIRETFEDTWEIPNWLFWLLRFSRWVRGTVQAQCFKYGEPSYFKKEE